MDPIKTAVKYALIPLRIVVQIGETFVGDETRQQAPPEPEPAAQRRQPQARRQQAQPRRAPQPKPDPQASREPKELDDVAVARKVESVIFRDPEVPKGQIDVNAADGVVWLRGEAKTPEMVKRLEAEAREIPEVRQVENLLHLPKTPAPTRTDTPPTQRKTRRSQASPATRRVETAVTNEGRDQTGEALPIEHARERRGREPSPLGSNGTST